MPSRVETTTGMERRGVYLLTNPRSASNMFQTMMSKQPSVQNSGYQFFDAAFPGLMQMERGPLSERSEAEREGLYAGYRAAWDKVQDDVASAEKDGLKLFTKEHTSLLYGPDKLYAVAYPEDKTLEPFALDTKDGHKSAHTNPTYLPDDYLLGLQPVFQIRHPALMFPSMLRTREKAGLPTRPSAHMNKALSNLRPTRELYEWYLHHEDALSPKVIDADDIMNDPGAVRQLCLETGLDPDAVLYEWETSEQQNPLKKAFLATLGSSKGILPGLDSEHLDMEKEKAKWVADWGEEDARDLEKLINDSMEDYEYLRSRRVRSV